MNEDSLLYIIISLRSLIEVIDSFDSVGKDSVDLEIQTRLLNYQHNLKKELTRCVREYLSNRKEILEKFDCQLFQIDLLNLLTKHAILLPD